MKKSLLFLILTLCLAVFSSNLEVTFLNVGQGDAVFIRTPSGKNYLIDGGQPAFYDPEKDIYYSRFDAGRDAIMPFFNEMGIEHLDGIVGTHPDADHIGGLVHIMRTIPVEKAYYTGKLHTSNIFQEFLNLIDEKNIEYIEVRNGDILNWCDDITVHVLGPTEKEVKNAKNNNNTSIVIKLEYGSISFILTGDAELEQETRISREWKDFLKSDVLKLGHHGSKTATTRTFLSHVNPDWAIISCGKGNKFGFPHIEVLRTLYAHNPDINLARTDDNGHIIFTTDGVSIDVSLQYGKFKKISEYSEIRSEKLRSPSTPPFRGKVNINTAELELLIRIPGIGRQLARNIIEYRKKHGDFSSTEEIRQVPRIGEKTYQKIKGYITTE